MEGLPPAFEVPIPEEFVLEFELETLGQDLGAPNCWNFCVCFFKLVN